MVEVVEGPPRDRVELHEVLEVRDLTLLPLLGKLPPTHDLRRRSHAEQREVRHLRLQQVLEDVVPLLEGAKVEEVVPAGGEENLDGRALEEISTK